jgi:hypothetical protein
MTRREPEEVHEEFDRQQLDDRYFSPMWEADEHDDRL